LKENLEDLTTNHDKNLPRANSMDLNHGPLRSSHELKDQAYNSLMDKIIKKAVLELGNNKTELKINIKPESMGPIKIQVVSENNHVNAKIITETEIAKEIIEKNIDRLRSDLCKNGMEMDSIDVSVEQKNQYEGSNYRDNDEKLLRRNDKLYRQVTPNAKEHSRNDQRKRQEIKDIGVDYYA
jgi:flagellar hook-length control protein FliK